MSGPPPDPPAQGSSVNRPTGAPPRLASLDAYRGFTMILMALNSYQWLAIGRQFPSSGVWRFVEHQFEHVAWAGCGLWDMIQPSFMFMVGVSMPFSYDKRQARGDSYARMLGHAVYRSVVLILLGVFLRSLHTTSTYWTFEDVLTQIGLGYVFLFLLWGRGWKIQLTAAVLILVGYWALFALWPLPATDYDAAAVGVKGEYAAVQYEGFQAHWNMNANPAHDFDRWFLNLFPRPAERGEFLFNGGGYQTLSFIPSLATMILGLLAGGLLKGGATAGRKLATLLAAGVGCIALGLAIDYAGLCPIVKRIWTPSFAIYSGGWCFLLLAAFYGVIDVAGFRRWAFPGIVVGMNAIAMYVLNYTVRGWLGDTLRKHLGEDIFQRWFGVYAPLASTLAVLAVLWLICYWMYRRRIFLRI